MKQVFPLLAALLVVATNLAALGLAALNRGAAESDIVLTERELRLVDSGSVTSLRINWMQTEPTALAGDMVSRAGFRADRRASDPDAGEYYQRQLQREVFVALEYDGPAWARYRDLLTRAPDEGNVSPAQRQQRAQRLAGEVAGHTRLFVVDVDTDAERLRSRHPDRGRYVITTARVNVMLFGSGSERKPSLSVRAIEPPIINLPRPFSTTLKRLAPDRRASYGRSLETAARYEVHLRYGRFHEPWIVDVRAIGAKQPGN